MNTPADRQPATLVLDAARMRLAVATARAAEADQQEATQAEAAHRRQATIEQLVRLRANAGRLSVQLAANQREAAAAAEQLAHASRQLLPRWRRRQTRRPDSYPHLRRLTAGQLHAHLRQLSTETADLVARLGRIATRQRRVRAELTRPEPPSLLSPTQIANRRAELTHATIAYVQARDRALPAPDAEGTRQTTTVELTRKAADRMAGQLTGYLTGPGRDRAHWTQRAGADEAPYWTTGALYDRWWAVHIPDPAEYPQTVRDHTIIVGPGFLTALGQAVATVAAAEQRPASTVITDILTTGRRTRTTSTASPAAGTALADRWQAHTPRPHAPRVIVRPARASRLDTTIAKVWSRAYRRAWHHQMHTTLVAEGTAALARMAKHAAPPPPPLPVDRDQAARLYHQITAGSVETYLTGHGWSPLDQTATVRRWHNGHDAIVEVPTDDGVDRQAMLRATAYTLADQEQREFGEVLVELTDPPLRDPHLSRVNPLLTSLPTIPDAQVADRLAAARVPTGGREVPLAEFARHQVDTLGVSDAVWKVATAAGQADAAARVAQLLGTTEAPPPTSAPVALFAQAGVADPAEQVAARIWAAGAGLPPAQHARWFANTWWPYHLTGTTGTVAAYLAGRLGHPPPAVLPVPGGPDHDLFKATDAAALPDRGGHDRFVATYRIVDAACRPRAVQAAAQAVRDHLGGADLPVDEPALAAAVVQAGDPRRFAHPPSDRGLRALTAAWPAGSSQQDVAAVGRPRPLSFPPPWKALAGVSRPGNPGSPSDVVDPARHRQRQLVTTAADAVHAGRVPTPPPMRTAPATRGTHR